MQKKAHKGAALLQVAVTILLLCAMLPQAVLAYEAIDLGRDASLTLQYEHADVRFDIYKVAQVSETAQFSVVDAFAGYGIDFSAIENNADWLALAQTLSGHVIVDDITSTANARTGENGQVTFAPLELGLYLVIGEPHRHEGYTCVPTPFFILLPNGNEDGKTWDYEVISKVKCEHEDDETQCHVIKTWVGDNPAQRPTQVQVQLLRNGVVYDSVILNDANGWRHSWTNLEAGYYWQVVETPVPDGYSVIITRQGNIWMVKNIYKGKPPTTPSKTPGVTPTPTPTPSGSLRPTPSYSAPLYTPTASPKPPQPGLPQTGQLWWPVPVLALVGLVLFSLGWIYKQRRSDNEETQ